MNLKPKVLNVLKTPVAERISPHDEWIFSFRTTGRFKFFALYGGGVLFICFSEIRFCLPSTLHDYIYLIGSIGLFTWLFLKCSDNPSQCHQFSNSSNVSTLQTEQTLIENQFQLGATCVKDGNHANSWSVVKASNFRVRSLNYEMTKTKTPSAPAMFEFMGIDLIKTDFKLSNIYQRVQYTLAPNDRLFILNAQVLSW